jgi:hypothetical protein
MWRKCVLRAREVKYVIQGKENWKFALPLTVYWYELMTAVWVMSA